MGEKAREGEAEGKVNKYKSQRLNFRDLEQLQEINTTGILPQGLNKLTFWTGACN